MTEVDWIELISMSATFIALVFAGFQLHNTNKSAKLDRAYQIIDRYYEDYDAVSTAPMMYAPFSDCLVPQNIALNTQGLIEIDWDPEQSRLLRFIMRLCKFWLRDSIDKDTVKLHLGEMLIKNFESIKRSIYEKGGAIPDYLRDWELVVVELRNPNLSFGEYLQRERRKHGVS